MHFDSCTFTFRLESRLKHSLDRNSLSIQILMVACMYCKCKHLCTEKIKSSVKIPKPLNATSSNEQAMRKNQNMLVKSVTNEEISATSMNQVHG